jgi:hypothetical protein
MLKHCFSLLIVAAFFCNVVQAQVSVIGELSNDREAKSGEKYEGIINVRNDTNEPLPDRLSVLP